MAGLDTAAVHRLKATKAALPAEARTDLQEAANLVSTDGNRHAYRRALAQAAQPCVPYLGVYLTDLTFIEDGNADTIAAPDGMSRPSGDSADETQQLINWRKHELYAGVIDEARHPAKRMRARALASAAQLV